MKQTLICLLLFATAFASCNRPRTIPDDKLEAIVEEVFLSNAYQQGRYMPMRLDSLDIYRPIFQRYGYKPADMLHTINSLTKRKSVRFSDILGNVITRLENRSNRYDSLVMLRDTIDARIAERYKEVIYTDSLHRFTRFEDAAKFEIRVPLGTGRYKLGFVYQVDTTDRNIYIQYSQHTLDSLQRRNNTLTRTLSKHPKPQREELAFTVTDRAVRELVINPVRIPSEKPQKTNITFDSLQIIRYPLIEEGRDRYLRDMLRYDSVMIPLYLNRELHAKDYVTLRPDTAGIRAAGDSVVRSVGSSR